MDTEAELYMRHCSGCQASAKAADKVSALTMYAAVSILKE